MAAKGEHRSDREADAVELSRLLAQARVKRSGLARTKRSDDPDVERFLQVLRSVASSRGQKRKSRAERDAIRRLAGA